MEQKTAVYQTVAEESGPEEFKEKGSKFISYLYPVKSKENAENIVSGLRKEFFDSTHVCFAYRLGEGKEEYTRACDDGEPSGTAGLPILNEIRSSEYFNVLVASIRYYGGTKLGTGGLIKAYGYSAKIVLEASTALAIHIKDKCTLAFPFTLTGEVMQVINRYDIKIEKQDYTESGTSMTLAIPVNSTDDADQMLFDITKGQLRFSR